jgi:alkylation response protein AidB-like acyl-CoA dehydrogenase
MDFTFSEDQNAIRDLAHQIFTDRATDEFLLEFSRSGKTYDDTLWHTLAEQGLLGICIPEAFGGTDLGFVELCLILEEQGRRVAPTPLFSSLVLGGLPIARFGTEAQKTQWLTPLASGDIKLTAAIAELGMTAAAAPVVRAEAKDGNWVLNGHKACVTDGNIADAMLVPAVDQDGKTTVFIVEANAKGLTRDTQRTSLGENEAALTFSNVSVDAGAVLGKPGEGACIIEWLEQYADAALCAMQVGVTEEALRRTAAFTGERKQFGMPIGSFQAVAMRAADAYIDVEAMRSTYWQAMWRLDEGLRANAEVRAAKWWACQGGHRVVHATQHLHGGMGSDVEFPIHRFFLWAKQIGFMLGGGNVQLQKLGALFAADNTVGSAALDV